MVKSKRECGSCSLCCKLMNVNDVVPAKQPHQWCSHAKPGCGGCGIYRTRPESCREFFCMWMLDERIKDHWYPARSKIVIHASIERGTKYVNFICDPAYPLRWREQPFLNDIKEMARLGLKGVLGERWTTVVQIGDQKIPIIGSERLLRAAK